MLISLLGTILIALAILGVLVAHWFVAREFYKAAAMKGWNEKKVPLAGFPAVDGGIPADNRAARPGGRGFRPAIVSDDLPEL